MAVSKQARPLDEENLLWDGSSRMIFLLGCSISGPEEAEGSGQVLSMLEMSFHLTFSDSDLQAVPLPTSPK